MFLLIIITALFQHVYVLLLCGFHKQQTHVGSMKVITIYGYFAVYLVYNQDMDVG